MLKSENYRVEEGDSMNKRKFLVIFIMFTFALSLSWAANISILVNQQNAIEEGTEQSGIYETTQVIENLILDSLFNYGHIVSNEPIVVGSKWEESNRNAIFAAVEGYVDYYVLVTIEYDVSQSTNPTGVIIENIDSITATVTNIWTNKVIEQLKITDLKSKGNETQLNNLSRIVSSLTNDINTSVRNKR